MKIDKIEVTTLVHATEEFDRVLTCLKNIIPVGFEYTVQKSYGHFKNPIQIIKAEIKRTKDTSVVIDNLKRSISAEDRRAILNEVDKRFDEGRLYISLDKMRAYYGDVRIGKGIQLVITGVSYPFNKKEILDGFREMIK